MTSIRKYLRSISMLVLAAFAAVLLPAMYLLALSQFRFLEVSVKK